MTKRIKKTKIFNKIRGIIRYFQSVILLKRFKKNIKNEAKYKILIINHFFSGEIKALTQIKEEFSDVEFLIIKPEPFFSEIIHLYPQTVRNAGIEYNSNKLINLHQKSFKISNKIYKTIKKYFNFNCVLTPSDSFYWLREFISICKTNKIPVIVSDKEGTISPYSFETEPYRIKNLFPPISDYYLVWSQRQKEFWIKAGVKANQITITGSPRSDIFINMKKKNPTNIIFFDFDLDAYINIIDWNKVNYDGERNWRYLRTAMRNSAKIIAREFSDINIILKCHPQQANLDFDTDLLNIKNIKIIRGGEISEMLSESFAVVGFQTTALMEAVLAKIPTFYIAWGKLYDIISKFLLPFHEEGYGMILCKSETELIEKIGKTIRRTQDLSMPNSEKLNIFFNYADGNCSKRLLSEIKKIIDINS